MFEIVERPLAEKERRALRLKAASIRGTLREVPRTQARSAAAAAVLLALLTRLATDAPWWAVLGGWALGGAFFAVSGVVGQRRRLRRWIERLDATRAAGRVREVRIRARAMVSFEEIEDEGACYAFDVGDGWVVFVVGQDFHETPRFPSTDFSLLEVLDPDGRLAELYVETRGARLPPERTVPRAAKRGLRYVEHLERLRVPLADVERALAE